MLAPRMDLNRNSRPPEVRHLTRVLNALKASSKSKDLDKGRKIHAEAVGRDLDSNLYVASSLIDMYAKCGSMLEARSVFDEMRTRDVVAWNSLILGYAQNGESQLALQMVSYMQCEFCTPDSWTFVGALKACIHLAGDEEGEGATWKLVKVKSLEKGMAIHAEALKLNLLQGNTILENTLVDMYSKCGSMLDSRRVFDGMSRRDGVSWTALLLGYAENGQGELALDLYVSMTQSESFVPDGRLTVAALKACSCLAESDTVAEVDGKPVKMSSLEIGMALHSASSYDESNVFIASSLIDMYAQCGSLTDAITVFGRIRDRDTASWNAMILAYTENGEIDMALKLFHDMQDDRCAPDDRTFIAVLKACAQLAVKAKKDEVSNVEQMEILEKGMSVHSLAVRKDCHSNVYIGCSLVDMYAKCGSMTDASEVFDRMLRHNVVSWTALILGYAEHGLGKLALGLFSCMLLEGCQPNVLTYVAALKAVTCLSQQEEARDVDGELVKVVTLETGMAVHSIAVGSGCDLDLFVASRLINMYSKSGSMKDACAVFEKVTDPDVVSWNELILGQAENGQGDAALRTFVSMQSKCSCTPDARTYVAALKSCISLAAREQGKKLHKRYVKLISLEKGMAIHARAASSGLDSDTFLENTLVDMYSKCGAMEDAQRVFDRITFPGVVSWTTLISGYAENGNGKQALDLFIRMQDEFGLKPDAWTLLAALKACGSVGAMDNGREIHGEICKLGFEDDTVVLTTLVDFYSKCGSMSDAVQVFETCSERNDIAWTVLVTGYGRRGDTPGVFNVFQRMQDEGMQPCGIVFLTLLAACSHAGLVDRGKHYFEEMQSRYGLRPSIGHFHCMIDLFARANQLDEALAVVERMPFKASVVTWTTVLSSCLQLKNMDVGRLAFDALLGLDGGQAAAFSLMANMLVLHEDHPTNLSLIHL